MSEQRTSAGRVGLRNHQHVDVAIGPSIIAPVHAHGRLTRQLLPAFAQVERECGGEGRAGHGRPQVAFFLLNLAILRSPDEQIDASRTLDQEQVVDIGLASPTLTNRVVGQAARAAISASRLVSHFWLSFSQVGRCL